MKTFILLFISFLNYSYGSILEKDLKKSLKTNSQYQALEKKILELGTKSVPSLISAMKSSDYPDKSRWLATLSLAKIMGDKSVSFIEKFLNHPHWMLRLASLKVIGGIKGHEDKLASSLFDKSLIIRNEALGIIKRRQIKEQSKAVWKMLFDKKNYSNIEKNKKIKPNGILKNIIETLGVIGGDHEAKMLSKLYFDKNYFSFRPDIDDTLEILTGKKSPEEVAKKEKLWKTVL
jgi:hypothetical protein